MADGLVIELEHFGAWAACLSGEGPEQLALAIARDACDTKNLSLRDSKRNVVEMGAIGVGAYQSEAFGSKDRPCGDGRGALWQGLRIASDHECCK